MFVTYFKINSVFLPMPSMKPILFLSYCLGSLWFKLELICPLPSICHYICRGGWVMRNCSQQGMIQYWALSGSFSKLSKPHHYSTQFNLTQLITTCVEVMRQPIWSSYIELKGLSQSQLNLNSLIHVVVNFTHF